MEDQMNQPGTMSPAPQKPKRPAKSQRKGGRLYTIEEANTFAASMCAMRHLVNERRDALDDRAVHSRGPEIDLTVARAASTLPRLSRREVPVGTRCRVDRDD